MALQIAASVRPAEGAEVAELPVGRRKSAPEQGVSSWGGEDSNLRPTDYESGNWEGADLQEFLNLLARGIT